MGSYRCFAILSFLFSIVVNAYPISRAAGAFYQSGRGNGIVKGGCLRYDAIEERLIATPFAGGMNCWNGGDWIVLLSPGFIFAGILTAGVDFCYVNCCQDDDD